MSTAIATPPRAKPDPARWLTPTNKGGLDALVSEGLRAEIERGLPRILRGQADRLIRAMVTECQRNPSLFDCTPASLFGGVIQAGQLGLVIGGPLGESYLIPFNNSKKRVKEAQLLVGYKGFLQLAHRSGQLARLTPVSVRDGDKFHYRRGTDQFLTHEPTRNNTGAVTDYYVSIQLVNGGSDFETFTFEEAVAHRDRFATTRTAPAHVRDRSPWYDMEHGFHEMALKTLVRKLAKRLPLSVDLSAAAGLDELAEHDIPQRLDLSLAGALPAEESAAVAGDEAKTDLRTRLDHAKGKAEGVTPPGHIPGVDEDEITGASAH